VLLVELAFFVEVCNLLIKSACLVMKLQFEVLLNFLGFLLQLLALSDLVF